MPLVTLLLTIAVLGLVIWLIDKYVPMAEPFKTIFRVIIVIAICIKLLSMIGVGVPLHL